MASFSKGTVRPYEVNSWFLSPAHTIFINFRDFIIYHFGKGRHHCTTMALAMHLHLRQWS